MGESLAQEDRKSPRRERKTPRKITKQYLENAALYYLQRYATSAENFRRVMTRKVKKSCAFHAMSPDEGLALIEKLMERYLASGLLNDATFARGRVETLRRQGFGRAVILAKLEAKGLRRPEIEAALSSLDAGHENAELAAARAFARRKKLGPWRIRARDPKKELAALARAGFGFDTARRALNAPEDDPA